MSYFLQILVTDVYRKNNYLELKVAEKELEQLAYAMETRETEQQACGTKERELAQLAFSMAAEGGGKCLLHPQSSLNNSQVQTWRNIIWL